MIAELSLPTLRAMEGVGEIAAIIFGLLAVVSLVGGFLWCVDFYDDLEERQASAFDVRRALGRAILVCAAIVLLLIAVALVSGGLSSWAGERYDIQKQEAPNAR